MIKGIDISYAQPSVDFSKLKDDDVNFAILRAGYGKYTSQKDAMFESHYENAKSHGLNVGCYWYSYAETVDDAKREAQACLEVIDGKQFEYPICYDMEEKRQTSLGSDVVSAMAKAFCDAIESGGNYVMLYSYASFLKSYVSEEVRKRYDIWVAHTGVDKPNYPMSYGIWQYSHTGKINALNGNVDLNYAHKDYPQIMKSRGFNGFSAAAESDKTDSQIESPAPEAIQPQYREYKVVKGDSFWRIAQNELGSGARYMEIVNLNGMSAEQIIYPDQTLKIPVK